MPTGIPERLSESLADRYRISREIGAGGMATVWLARDLKFDRDVAIKVLRDDVTVWLGPERFLREIATTARLMHPHILPLLDSGSANGLLYYVMPFVSGESLRERLHREKQLGLDDALQITREAADALNYAHAQGVVHRDIKPENILLASGHAMVADFGIARAMNEAGGERLTASGLSLGTPAYMSPEQASGSRDLDGRSDLYSLGCVLFEMLAGEPPFTGASVERVVQQHLMSEPPNITAIRASVPSGVVTALTRALAKTPADRFNSVAQFADAIAPHALGTSTPADPVVAGRLSAKTARVRRWPWFVGGAVTIASVLVALVLSQRPDSQTGSNGGGPIGRRPWVLVADFDGTADSSYRRAAQQLAQSLLDGSAVAASLPVEQVRGLLERAGKPETTVVTEAIARELAVRGGIGTVVAGRLDRVGSSYSILLRLVRSETGEVLASEPGSASEDSLMRMIDQRVRALRARLGEKRASLDAERTAPDVMTASFAAYRKYAEGQRLAWDEGKKDEADNLMRQALQLDPEFASAWLFIGLDPNSPGRWAALDSARAHGERLTPVERARLEWTVSFYRWHLSDAAQYAEQWRRERPNDWMAWNVANMPRNALRSTEEGIAVLDSAAWLSPGSANVAAGNRTNALIIVGRRDDARREAQRIRNEATRLGRLLTIAELDGAWAVMDSIGPLWEHAYLAMNGRAAPAPSWRRTRQYVRGEVRAAQAPHAPAAQSQKPPLLAALAMGALVTSTSTDTTWAGAFRKALGGDTVAARSDLPRLTADALDYRAQSGYWRAAIEAAIALRRDDWCSVVQHAGPLLRDHPAVGTDIGTGVRWAAAHAYERLNRLDSAVTLLGDLVEPRRVERIPMTTLPYGAANSYLRQHLIVLLARMGRVKEARRHWELFRAAFTNPDPEFRHLLDEARTALEEAERKAR